MKIWLFFVLLLFAAIYSGLPANAQYINADTTYVRRFEKENVVELSHGIDGMELVFTNPLHRKNNIRLNANSSEYAGGYINYKWLVFFYTVPLPYTKLDNEIKTKSYSFAFRFNFNHQSLRPYFNYYKGLLQRSNSGGSGFEHFKDFTYLNAGFDYHYYFNKKTFSFEAANSFSVQQLKSAGSPFFILMPQWQKLKLQNPVSTVIKDSSIRRFLSQNPSSLSLMADVGYHYNFAFKGGKINIAPMVALGGGIFATRTSISKAIHIRPAQNYQAALIAGYNGSLFYGYLSASYKYTNYMHKLSALKKNDYDFSATVGYRFGNAAKKIFKIL